MTDPDRAMLAYLNLAALSAEKQQRPGRDRFLILGGAAACHAGLIALAERCREIVLKGNPRHLIGQHNSFPDAMRHADFQPLVQQLTRLCPPEQAEHLLQESGATFPEPITSPMIETQANLILTKLEAAE